MRVHFSGIGGTGMVAAARLAVDAGWEVRGSDNPLYPPTSDMVAALGVHVYQGYAASNLDWGPELVVLGNALSRGNAEVEAALDRRLRYVSFPEWLKEFVLRERTPVVIAGTHGKSTTTTLTAWLLECAGMRPGFLIGAQPTNFEHSSRLGKTGAPFVVEGDEYDTAFYDKRAKFFHYLPQVAVVTSVEFDHGDIYRDLAEIETAFERLLRLIPQSGALFVCADDPGARRLRERAYCPVETYGIADDADWRIERLDPVRGLERFVLHHGGEAHGPFETELFGLYNLRNAAAAIAVAKQFGATDEQLREGLAAFRGLKRRMEIFHRAKGIDFIDDFAHHPTAMRETIAAARLRWPERRLLVLFEPRSNTSVTNRFQAETAESLRGAHRVWIGPIYRAEKIPEGERLDRGAVVEFLRGHGAAASFSDDVDGIVEEVRAEAKGGDVVLILSNGAFGGIYGKIRGVFS